MLLFLLAALLACPSLGSAAGLLLTHDADFWRPWPPIPPVRPPPPPPPAWEPIETRLTKVDVQVRDQVAITRVEQEFYNPNPRPLEGTFLIPVPRGAQLRQFTLDINGKPVEAEFLPADKARALYEDIVRRTRDPALLEYAGRDLYKVRLFPIEPRSQRRVVLSWSQVLKSEDGLVNYTLPLAGHRQASTPIQTLGFRLQLETSRPLKSVYSPSHALEIRRDGPQRATLGYEARNVRPDTDLQVYFSTAPEEVGGMLLAHRVAGQDGYFLWLAAPGVAPRASPPVPKDVVLVLDTSGSMAGAKLEQARKALLFCVENLNEGDRFDLLRFASEVEPLFDRLTEVTPDSRARARSFVRELKPIGGTAIDDALRKALALKPAGERPYVVVFLTDGLPTVGKTREEDIWAGVRELSDRQVRVFCFGLGTDVNTHLLDRVAEDTRARSQYVLPEEDIEVKVSGFFSKVKDPVLAGPRLQWPEGVRVNRMYPSPVPDLFQGEQVVLVGRYHAAGRGEVVLEGTVNGQSRRFRWDATFPEVSAEHDFLPRLWATRRVGHLLDAIRLNGENAELKEEVVTLARQFGIVTPYTAGLIVEDEARRGVPVPARTVRMEPGAARDQVELFRRLNEDRSGAAAVAGARSYATLKSAEAPAPAIAGGAQEALRVAPTAGPGGARPGPAASGETAAASRFAGGKAFYRMDSGWVEAGVQAQANARRVSIAFGSADYFDLLRREPEVAPWLALGCRVAFVLRGTVYEVGD